MKKLMIALLLTPSIALASPDKDENAILFLQCMQPAAKSEYMKSGLNDFNRNTATKALLHCSKEYRTFMDSCTDYKDEIQTTMCENTVNEAIRQAANYALGRW